MLFRSIINLQSSISRILSHLLLSKLQIFSYLLLVNTIFQFDNRSEEHTSELQSLKRISYAVFSDWSSDVCRSEERTSELQSLKRISYAVPKRSAVPARAELTAAKTGSLPQAPQSARAAQTSAASPTAPQAVSQPAVGMSTELLSKIASADWQALQTLSQHCTACALSAMGRQHVVFSDGGPGPKLVVVGEAPGAEEDLQGIPFVGKSGKLLTAMLDSLGLDRKSVV